MLIVPVKGPIPTAVVLNTFSDDGLNTESLFQSTQISKAALSEPITALKSNEPVG